MTRVFLLAIVAITAASASFISLSPSLVRPSSRETAFVGLSGIPMNPVQRARMASCTGRHKLGHSMLLGGETLLHRNLLYGRASAQKMKHFQLRVVSDLAPEETEESSDYEDEDSVWEEDPDNLFSLQDDESLDPVAFQDDDVDPRTIYMPADEAESAPSWFATAGLLPGLCDALKSMGISIPTNIQEASLPTALAGESVLLCAETGSGKTLAFLLPLIQRIKRDEGALGIVTRPHRPRGIVLSPTRELGQQILLVAKGLSQQEKFSSCGLFGGSSMAKQAERLSKGVDIVVGTPGRMVELVADGHMRLGDVRFIVADEADTMASQGFGDDLRKLFSSVVAASEAAKESYHKAELVRSKLSSMIESAETEGEVAELRSQIKQMRGPFAANDKGHVQCILAAATVPESVRSIIQDTFPRFREVKTAKAHKVPDRIAQEFVRVTGNDRAQKLLEVIDRGQRMNKAAWARSRELDNARRDATIVFCNTKDTAVFASKLLREEGYEVAEGHGWLPQTERAVQLESFISGKVKILVSTDIMARGIDTINVAHVVNFDFPRTPVDYLHRVGRTARSGGSGRVTNFVAKRDYTLATAIERASKLGKSIETLSSKRSDYVQGTPGMLKSEKPVRTKRDSEDDRPRRSATVPKFGRPVAKAAKPKPKDTTMKKMNRIQPKKSKKK